MKLFWDSLILGSILRKFILSTLKEKNQIIVSDVEKVFDITQIIELIKGTQDKNRKRHILYVYVCTYVRKNVYMWTGIYILGSPGSQAFRCGLNFTTGFLRSPACRFHSCISQFFIINLLETEPSYWFCFYGEL